MSDPQDPTDESPMQRALRMKKTALQARPKAPDARTSPRAASGMAAGVSKPWMKK